MTRILNVADARRRAHRVLPKVVFDYVDGGAEDEVTMHENVAAFKDLAFRPRMAVGARAPTLSVRLFGNLLRIPVILAPCGLSRLMHPDGPAGAAQAAASRGTLSVLSTVAGVSMEEVAARSVTGPTTGHPPPMWFQLYAAGGRTEAEALINRAEAAGYSGLVVTVDTPVLGHRERDVRNGVDPPLRITAQGIVHLGPQVLSRPLWTWRMAREGLSMFGSAGITGRAGPGGGAGAAGAGAGTAPTSPSVVSTSKIASPFRWSDVEWIRRLWRGPLLVKGVLTGSDAARAVACGADAVIVSNHGGRQLEGAPATLRALPEVVAEVSDDVEVLVDGGIRRGSDVVKAMALGASAVLVGRPYLYGLSVAGRRGVEQILDIFKDEMTRTMTLLGCPGVDSLDSSWLQPSSAGFGVSGYTPRDEDIDENI